MPIRANRLSSALVAAPLLLAATAVAAQDLSEMRGLTACRSGAATVDVAFSYDGSACETVGNAWVDSEADKATASFPTEREGEICTQQVVDIGVSQQLVVPTSVKELEVVRLDPDGNPAATASTAIMATCDQG